MTNTFGTTGATSHSQNISGLENENSYIYYVRCMDSSGNKNTNDFSVSFSINSNLTPIYRLYNTLTGVHLYTRGEADRNAVMNKWPEFEFTDGVPAFYASLTNDGKTPIYRLYNTRTGVHLYTRGADDRDAVLNKWSDFEFTDGVPAFYASLTQ